MKEDSHHNFDNVSKEDGFENPVGEKWIVSFIKMDNLKKIYYRQFFVAGFYEAYYRVITFLEKTYYKIYCIIEK